MRNWWIWCVNARLLLNPFCRFRRKMTYRSWTNTKLTELLIKFRDRLNKIRHTPRESQRKKTRRPVRWGLNNIGKRLKEKLVIRNRKIQKVRVFFLESLQALKKIINKLWNRAKLMNKSCLWLKQTNHWRLHKRKKSILVMLKKKIQMKWFNIFKESKITPFRKLTESHPNIKRYLWIRS